MQAKHSFGVVGVVGVVGVDVVAVVGYDGIKGGEDEQDILRIRVSGVPEFDQSPIILMARSSTEAAIGMRRWRQGQSDLAPRRHGSECRGKTRYRRARARGPASARGAFLGMTLLLLQPSAARVVREWAARSA